MIALVVGLLLSGYGLVMWGRARLELDRAKAVRASAARREKAAELTKEEAASLLDRAAELNRDTIGRRQRWTATDRAEFPESLGWSTTKLEG